MNYVSTIQLQTLDIYNVEARWKEVQEIRDWLDDLVSWQPNKYEMKYRSGDKLDVWFEEEKHAAMCILRWS